MLVASLRVDCGVGIATNLNLENVHSSAEIRLEKVIEDVASLRLGV
jgi:hypothetical protein